jgi:Zn-dependent peptidase ImmA (M78 family)/DNA-binding XRE family transcriptional regulator
MTQVIGVRLKALREERGLSQEELARQLGFNDRQTLSAIETGERRVSAEELILAVQKLGVPLDYFTDPFMLVGEGRFSWRQTNVGPQRLSAYERSAGRWIAAFRVIAPKVGRETPLLRRSLGLTRQQRYEDAASAGERFAAEFDLGQVPANSLADVLERQFGVLVLMVDAFEGISGAACRLPELDAVLINRREIAGRRHFDLAHELFHILTWDAMPPDHVEDAAETSKNRVEQLANSFASAVLMPTTALERFGDWAGLTRNDLITKLNATADQLRVTASALKWRLVHVGHLSIAAAREIRDAALRNNGHEGGEANPPPLFSKPFVDVISLGLKQGLLSARRSAALLDVPMDELSDLFRSHGVEAPDEL